MGKKVLIVAFVLCFGLALYVYLTREHKSLRETLSKRSAKDPRIVMEDFTLFRYRDEVLTSKLSARLGHFYEPNIVELDGEVRGERLARDGREMIGAESATAYFDATTLSGMLAGAQLDRAELTGFVEVGLKDHLLTTDYAEYITKDGIIRSLRPVRVEGVGRVINGEEGFVYNLGKETLDMPGTVKGVVTIDEN